MKKGLKRLKKRKIEQEEIEQNEQIPTYFNPWSLKRYFIELNIQILGRNVSEQASRQEVRRKLDVQRLGSRE